MQGQSPITIPMFALTVKKKEVGLEEYCTVKNRKPQGEMKNEKAQNAAASGVSQKFATNLAPAISGAGNKRELIKESEDEERMKDKGKAMKDKRDGRRSWSSLWRKLNITSR